MKRICVLLISVIILVACKKETDSPAGSNKIDIGNTSIDSVSYFRAHVTTNLISTGGNAITQHGHCISKAEQPTVDDLHSSLGSLSNPKSFTSNLKELDPNTTYFIRAYVSTSNAILYGNQQQLTTLKTGKPVVQTGNFYAPDVSSAYGEGVALADSGLAIIQKGFCWSNEPDPGLTNNLGYSEEGPGLGSFADTIAGLTEGTDYFVAAYATNEMGTSYGEIKTFQTIPITLPSVTTAEISNVTTTSAVSGGEVTDNGNGTVSARGVCWDTQPNPTLDQNAGLTNDGYGIGEFVSNFQGLNDGTNYYYTAYATNEKGTAYGEINQFVTLQLDFPEVITIELFNITDNSAICLGEVVDEGNGDVNARGVCWNKVGNPTLENNISYTLDGSGIGSFSSTLTELEDNTTYYVATYATNEKGTAYGGVKDFITPLPCGELTLDYGGQTYHTVPIGEQCWMKENLNIGTRINGSQEQTDNSKIEKYCYGDNEANCNEYGGLYQWNEMMQYATQEGVPGICPDGWHLPTDEEWKILEGTVDSQYGVGDLVWDQTGYRGYDAGKNLKSTYGWYNNGNGTDFYGFKALPGGLRFTSGDFVSLEGSGPFWMSSEYDIASAWVRRLYYDNESVRRTSYNKDYGFSVRCIKNE